MATIPRGAYEPTWDDVMKLPTGIRTYIYEVKGNGTVQAVQTNRVNIKQGPLLNPEPLAAVNKILIDDMNILLESGFKYSPYAILTNEAFSRLVAVYQYINGQYYEDPNGGRSFSMGGVETLDKESYVQLGMELLGGVDVRDINKKENSSQGLGRFEQQIHHGGRRRTRKTKKSSRRRHR